MSIFSVGGSELYDAIDIVSEEILRRLDSCGTLKWDLYSGLSGIAIALHDASRVLDAPTKYSRVADRFLTQLVSLDIEKTEPGLFNGLAGVIWGAHRLGLVQQIDRWPVFVEALTTKTRALASCSKYGVVDLLSGTAGILVTLAELSQCIGDSSVQELMNSVTDSILDRSLLIPDGCCWHTMMPWCEQPLGGFAHGTSGIAFALGRVFDQTGRLDLPSLMRAALQYERKLFCNKTKIWTDRRILDPLVEQTDVQFTTDGRLLTVRGPISNLLSTWGSGGFKKGDTYHAWCHGACGILLSRLDFLKRSQESEIIQDAQICTDSIESLLLSSGSDINVSLCHGLSSILDALHQASECQLVTTTISRAKLIGFAIAPLRRVEYSASRLRDGLPVQNGPPELGLMTGLAGYLHVLCRLCSPHMIPPVSNLTHRCSVRSFSNEPPEQFERLLMSCVMPSLSKLLPNYKVAFNQTGMEWNSLKGRLEIETISSLFPGASAAIKSDEARLQAYRHRGPLIQDFFSILRLRVDSAMGEVYIANPSIAIYEDYDGTYAMYSWLGRIIRTRLPDQLSKALVSRDDNSLRSLDQRTLERLLKIGLLISQDKNCSKNDGIQMEH
ncbi:lanthionine synthetase LanC family protein [uncultured Gimesia sp.]|uniref:lanthionine synthetase LanC family protein n=1 Tax=uncultured Gimesia sp. TaxID=1678688 RepID=UPI0030D6EA22|tara:strand:+ start:12121 stop:13956 length:1836 start_codon:yes stop_codon:yes gene_type:complete